MNFGDILRRIIIALSLEAFVEGARLDTVLRSVQFLSILLRTQRLVYELIFDLFLKLVRYIL